jgi:hypothetical protein
MNSACLGDSGDVVKRFWCDVARALGYAVYIDPMFTGDWMPGQRSSFLRFVGARPLPARIPTPPAALLIDPDKGIRAAPGSAHATFDAIAIRCRQFALVIVSDQAFSRGPGLRRDMARKLHLLRDVGVRGVYYDSPARFLICSKGPGPPMRFRKALVRAGLPAERFVGLPKPAG